VGFSLFLREQNNIELLGEKNMIEKYPENAKPKQK